MLDRAVVSMGIFSALAFVAPVFGEALTSGCGCERPKHHEHHEHHEHHDKSEVKGPMSFIFEIQFPTAGLSLPEHESITLYVVRPDGKIKTTSDKVKVVAGDLAFPLTLTEKVEVFKKGEKILNGVYHYGVEVKTKNIEPAVGAASAQIVSFANTVEIEKFESVILPTMTPIFSRDGRVFQVDASWVFNPDRIPLLKE